MAAARSVTQRELFQAAQQNDFHAVGDYLQVLFDEAEGEQPKRSGPGSRAVSPKVAVVTSLLESKTRNTLLHYACDNGNIDACKILLMCDGMTDAFLNEPNAFGHTPLFYAASSGKLPLVKWLISNGADIDTDYSDRDDVAPRDEDFGIFTPLQIACFKGHEDVVNFLVECNASLAGTARNGKTPLHFASSQSHQHIIKILLEAGADTHACDDQGKTPVDVAPADLLPLLLPDEHGGAAADNDDDALETNRADADSENDDDEDDGFVQAGGRGAAMVNIRNAFGADIARQFRHKSWKHRVQAINEATIVLQNTASSSKSLGKLFEGGSEMIVVALQDAVSQVVSSSCTGLLKGVFSAAMGGGIKDFHTAKFHQDHPLIKKIADLLLLRGAGSNEKDASEAVASLLFLICKSTDITRYLTTHISGIMQFTPSTAVTMTPTKGSDASSSSSTSWRLQLVAIKILNTVASQYRLDDAMSGLSFNDAIKISTTALENASVHVRSASIDLLVQCLLIRCEQSDVSGSLEAIFDQMKSWSEAIFKQHNLALKPSIQAKINNGLKNALQQSKRLNGLALPVSPRSETAERRSFLKTAVALEMPTAATGAASPRSKGAQKEDDLPYAEPIQEQLQDEVAPVLACFGEKLTRCLFSNAWAPRVEAISLLQFQVESKHLKFRDAKNTEQLLSAMQKTLLIALQDRVNSVYEAGVALLTEFAIALNSTAQKTVAQDLIRPMIPRLLTKLGDTKARLHVTTEDALLLLSRQEASLGAEYLIEEMIACDRNASVQSLSPTYISNKLAVISKLLLEFGVKEANDQTGLLSIKLVLQPALQVFEHRDPNVRQVALQIVGDTVKTARTAAMPFLDALARASRQKIIAKLVERGVLEADLLMDEVDEFDIAINDTSLRPGTSGGVRPPTASGSSTKHRPALSSASISSAPSATMASSGLSQAPALPYGTALTQDQETTFAHLIECFGEQLVRCLLDKAWAQREAAIREIERLVVGTASGKLPADKALTKSPDTLRILSQCVELGLNDTVARVFQCTLRLCQLIATEFVPIVQSADDEGDIIDSFLERTASAALQKFGDTKQRLRADCFTLLHSLAALSHVGQRRMCRVLVSRYSQIVAVSPTSAFASSPLVGAELFKLFAVLIRDSYANSAAAPTTRPELGEILRLIADAFENKHVDVRSAAIEAYTTIYEVTNGGSSVPGLDLSDFFSQIKPAIRDAITRKVVQISKLSLPSSDVGDDRSCHEIDSSRQQPLALDINKLRHFGSKEITEQLTSPSAGQRCAGVDKLMALFVESPRNPQFQGAWETSCLLAKQLLLDGTPGVCLVAFQLLWLIADPPTATCEYAIPWGEWGVHLILGSTIRSVVQQSANGSVRVRTQVKAMLQLIAKKSSAGRNAVCNAILSAPEQRDVSSEPSQRLRKIALCKLRWQWMLRLEMMQDLLQEKEAAASAVAITPSLSRRKSSSSGTKAGADSLGIENIVPFLGSCMVHPSPLVRTASRKIMAQLKTQTPSAADEVARFVQQECSQSLQRRLQPLLADDDDADDNNVAHTDHFNAEDATVVRGSRASHVRRIAALRPPRSVPVEEKSLAVDVFPPPHSAPGKSRRSLQADDDEEFGDYVVKPKTAAHKENSGSQQQKQPQQQQAPIWLTNNSSQSSKRGSDDPLDASSKPSVIAVGGGAANLVKLRRKSSVRSNNGDDDDYTAPPMRAQRSGY